MHAPPGRGTESALIAAACARATSGSGGLVLITGEAGIGKSSLASTVVDADPSMPVLRGYCVDNPGAPPLWPWIRVGRDHRAITAALAASTEDGALFTLAMAFCDALRAVAGDTGAVIVVEDMHWADSASVTLLRLLAPELGSTKVLVVATARDDPRADSAWTRELPGLLRTDGVTHLPLRGLDVSAVSRWLDDTSKTAWAPHVRRLVADTGGNPFYIGCLVRELEPTPDLDLPAAVSLRPTLRRTFVGTFAALEPDARRTVGTAAILGERLSPALLAAALDLPLPSISDHLALAVDAGILQFGPTGLAFRHALVRDAIVADLSVADAATAHADVAQALEAAGDPLLTGAAAVHWAAVGTREAAHRCLNLARAATRSSVAAPDRAVALAQLAVDSARIVGASDADVAADLTELARHQWSAGLIHPALATCAVGIDLAEAAGLAELMADIASIPQGVGSVDVAQVVGPMCRRALDALDPAPAQSVRHARLLATLAVVDVELHRISNLSTDEPPRAAGESADELSARALAIAVGAGDPQAELEAIAARHFVLSHPFGVTERDALAARAQTLAPSAHTTIGALWGHLWEIDLGFQLGRIDRVEAAVDGIEEVARRRRSPVARWHTTRTRAALAAFRGDFEDAKEFDAQSYSIARQVGDIAMAGMHHAFELHLADLRDDPGALPDDALATLRNAPPVLVVRAMLPTALCIRGDRAAALDAIAGLRSVPARLAVGPQWGGTIYQLGRAAVRLHDADLAAACYDAVAPIAHWCGGDGGGMPFAIGSNELSLGDLAQVTGNDSAAGHYERAAVVNERMGARPLLWLARVGLAETQAATDPERARGLAYAAAGAFAALDMPGPLARARAVLAGVGAVAPTPPVPGELTPREWEVAQLVAQALTNQQIAQRLFLSVRTVESHIRNALRKSGSTSRTELALWVRNAR